MKIAIVFFVLSTLCAYSVNAVADDSPSAACERVKDVSFPAEDQPKESDLASLKDCNSEALYYGIGRPVDYPAALRCAFAEDKAGNEKSIFSGKTILMMLYANGFGTKPNLDLAIHLACGLQAAPAESEGRSQHLEKMKASPPGGGPFDICDDITSGYMQGICTGRSERMADAKRSERLNSMISKWSEPQQTAFKKLKTAAESFANLRSDKEVDQSGTGRGAFVMTESGIQKQDFINSVEMVVSNTAPKYTGSQLEAEDRKLNALLKKIQASPKDSSMWGTVTKEGIRETQISWGKYRDAWIEFAKIKNPAYSGESVATWFTKKRNHMLRSFAK